MRILVLSDLHVEFRAPYVPPPEGGFDVVVLAGDIHSPGERAVAWAIETFAPQAVPVLLVAGNHEHYRREMASELERMRAAAAGSNVYLLNCDEFDHQGVRFLGCTLWTDFQLEVEVPGRGRVSDPERALAEAQDGLNDFRFIRHGARTLTAQDTAEFHARDRAWLQARLAEPHAGPTVVITHHAPARGSVATPFASSWLTPAFVSDLPAALFDRADLWVHGHTHASSDYRVGTCRVVANPRGYPVGQRFENLAFDVGCVVEV